MPSLVDASSGAVIAGEVRFARNPWTRTVGLLGRVALRESEGMIFERCSSLHTFFMRMPIDIVFVDAHWYVVDIESCVIAWRVVRARAAEHAIELAPGTARRKGLSIGQELKVRPS